MRKDPAANESLVGILECPGICGTARDEWSAVDARTPVTLEEAVPPTPSSTLINLVQSQQCWSGRRKDCSNGGTCYFRHVGEKTGDAISKYTKLKAQCLS